MKRLFSLATPALLFAVAVPHARPQQSPCLQRTIIASVVDHRGLPIKGLATSDFRANFRGQPVCVRSVELDSRPRRITVVLDASETMRDESSGKWRLAQEIAQHIIENGPPGSVSTIATFGTATKPPLQPNVGEPVIQPRSLEDLMHGLMRIGRAERRPPLFDVISGGLALLPNPQPGDVILIITDGGEEASKTKPEELQRRLLSSGVRLFAVTLPMRYDVEGLSVNSPEVEEQRESTDFFNTVQTSGGKVFRIRAVRRSNQWGFHFDDKERLDLATSLQLLYLQMGLVYRLEIELPQPVEEITNWKLEVTTSEGSKKSLLHLIYPKKLVPCAPPDSAAK